MFIFIKTTSPYEGNLKTERVRNSGEPLFYVPCWSFRCQMCTTKKHALCDIFFFFKNHESWTKQIVYLKWALANLQNMTIYYPSEKYKLSICSFSEYYCYQIVFVHFNNFVLLKKMFGAWHKCVQNFFSPELESNFYQVFYLYNNATFILFQWNIFSPLNFFYQTHHDGWLTDWHSRYSCIHKWHSFPNASISYNSVASHFNF